MSDSSENESEEHAFDHIQVAAENAGILAQQASTEKRLAKIEAQLASSEALFEQLQENTALQTKLAEYVQDLRIEQDFFNEARHAVGALASVAIVGLIVLLGMALFSPQSPLLKAPPVVIAAFILGLVSGIVLMLNSLIKGIFRSTNERHADGFLPPALENAADLLNKITRNN